jgi:hypothetical protein
MLADIADAADRIVAATGSEEAAVAFLSRRHGIEPGRLRRYLYDQSGSLADVFRADAGRGPLVRGRRGPLSRLLAAVYDCDPSDREAWGDLRLNAMLLARSMGDTVFRRVAPILRLSEGPEEAAEALLALRGGKGRFASVEAPISRKDGSRGVALGLFGLKHSSGGRLVATGPAERLAAFGKGAPTISETMVTAAANFEVAARMAGHPVLAAETCAVGGRIHLAIVVPKGSSLGKMRRAAVATDRFGSVLVREL